MPRRAMGHEAIARSRDLLVSAKTADELRVAQAVLFPLLLEMSVGEVGDLIGRSAGWVSRQRNRHLRGIPPTDQRGGRRNALLSPADELELVKLGLVIHQTRFGYSSMSLRGDIRQVIEERLGRLVGESTLSGIIKRVANVLIVGGCPEDLLQISRTQIGNWKWDFRKRGLLPI